VYGIAALRVFPGRLLFCEYDDIIKEKQKGELEEHD